MFLNNNIFRFKLAYYDTFTSNYNKIMIHLVNITIKLTQPKKKKKKLIMKFCLLAIHTNIRYVKYYTCDAYNHGLLLLILLLYFMIFLTGIF